MEPEVVLLIGLQAGGKTTFYRRRFAATHAHVSKDLMPRSVRHKEERVLRELATHLGAGRSVVVDNTQPSRAERAGVIHVACSYGGPRRRLLVGTRPRALPGPQRRSRRPGRRGRGPRSTRALGATVPRRGLRIPHECRGLPMTSTLRTATYAGAAPVRVANTITLLR